MIDYGKQSIDQFDIEKVVDVLQSNWLTQGPKVAEFETALSKKFGSKYCSAVSSGTAALHLAALALEWSSKDIIITSPITFLATANCIIYAGATPDFVDIDEVSYTIDPNKLEEKIKSYHSEGKKIKAVIGVDYAGHPCDWKALRQLADRYEFQLVNDNCHAMGASYMGNKQYALQYADVITQSYHPVKHITTGEGGAVLTNESKIHEKVKLLSSHGITKDSKYLEKNDGQWYYEMHEIGFNYRITDAQCALGISQLKKLDNFVNKRKKIAKKYDRAFEKDKRFIIPLYLDNIQHAYHLYPLQLKFKNIGLSRKLFFEKMMGENIRLQVHYIPVHSQPFYKNNFGFKENDFPNSLEFYQQEISLPIYPGLSDDELMYVIQTIKNNC